MAERTKNRRVGRATTAGPAETRTRNTDTRMMGASWLNIVLGAVVFLTPFFTTTSTAALWSGILVGALIIALEVYDLYAESTNKEDRVAGPEVINVLAGIWLIAFPFFTAASMAYLWTNVLAGIVLAVSAGYNVRNANRHSTARPV